MATSRKNNKPKTGKNKKRNEQKATPKPKPKRNLKKTLESVCPYSR